MSGHRVLVLDGAGARELLNLETAVDIVETAYRAHASGDARLFPVVREPIDGGAVCGVKSGWWAARGVIGLKLAGYWPANAGRDLANHQATVLLADAGTGRLLAVIDGNAITERRTAAAGVVGVRRLARPDSRTLAVLGTGAQAEAQATALCQAVPSLRELRIWGRSAGQAEGLGRRLAEHFPGLLVRAAASVGEALRGADVVVTATPSREPLFAASLLEPGAHINAMGSDTAGKRELPTGLVESSTLVVDDRAQARALGESQPPVAWHTPPPTMGEVLLGTAPGRTSPGEVTIFDSTGLGLQDLTAAESVYRLAAEGERGLWVAWNG